MGRTRSSARQRIGRFDWLVEPALSGLEELADSLDAPAPRSAPRRVSGTTDRLHQEVADVSTFIVDTPEATAAATERGPHSLPGQQRDRGPNAPSLSRGRAPSTRDASRRAGSAEPSQRQRRGTAPSAPRETAATQKRGTRPASPGANPARTRTTPRPAPPARRSPSSEATPMPRTAAPAQSSAWEPGPPVLTAGAASDWRLARATVACGATTGLRRLAVACRRFLPPPPLRPVRVASQISHEALALATDREERDAVESQASDPPVPATATSTTATIPRPPGVALTRATVPATPAHSPESRTEADLLASEPIPRPTTGRTERAPSVAGSRIQTVLRAPLGWSRATWERVGNLALSGLLSLAFVVFATVAVGLVTGHRFETVVTGSMTPVIPVGSMVMSERTTAGALHVGDILVFPKPTNERETIVHRISRLAIVDGKVRIHTKGDANAVEDAWTVERDAGATADRAVWIFPGVGSAATVLRNIAIIGLILVVLGVIGYWGLRLTVRQTRAPSQA